MFIVIEIQVNETASTIVNSYDTRNEAEARYHTILSAAAASAVPKHSAVLLSEEGYYLKSEVYKHGEE